MYNEVKVAMFSTSAEYCNISCIVEAEYLRLGF